MHDVQNQHDIVLYNAVDDDVIVCRKAAQAGAQIIITPSPHVRILGQLPETLGDGLHHASGGIDAAALTGDA